jgi:hypothetical protein
MPYLYEPPKSLYGDRDCAPQNQDRALCEGFELFFSDPLCLGASIKFALYREVVMVYKRPCSFPSISRQNHH